MAKVEAEPYEFEFEPRSCALVIIDMQRDFVDPGGFGEALGNDVSLLRKAIKPTQKVLEAARSKKMLVIHTREGHRPDLSDLPPSKKLRGHLKTGIGDKGPMGRILVRGEYGHDIVDELKPAPGEPVVDKPGKGAFYATDLDSMLHNRGIQQPRRLRRHHRGVRQHHRARGERPRLRLPRARGLRRLVLSRFQKAALEMIKAQGGIFGWVSDSKRFLAGLTKA